MVASVFGSESRENTSQPAEAKADPTEPVPEKSSSKRIYLQARKTISWHLEAFEKYEIKILIRGFIVNSISRK